MTPVQLGEDTLASARLTQQALPGDLADVAGVEFDGDGEAVAQLIRLVAE